MILLTNNQEDKVKGISFLLSHFEGRQRLFPRMMSTVATEGGQFIVYNKEQIFEACKKADFIDCRINAYPILEEGLLQAPNLIFIDLDLQDNLKQLNKNLDKTLKIIKQKLNGCQPTVLWSGNGYHIYIVLDVRPLELIQELRELSDEPSTLLLRFIETAFTYKKNDSQHYPSLKSCMLRIPGTFNSKNNLEVRIIQKFDKNHIPKIDNSMLRQFRLYLADLDIKRKLNEHHNERKKKKHAENSYTRTNSIPKCYHWVEGRLLKTPLSDYRKRTIDFVLVPYFINIKRLTKEQAYYRIIEYIIKCNQLKSLQPSVDFFNNKIRVSLDRSLLNKFLPIKIENIKDKYVNWFECLVYHRIVIK